MKVYPVTFAGVMDAAFNQIRQYGKGSPSVMIRLMEALVTIDSFAGGPLKKESVRRHAGMVLQAAEDAQYNPNDLKDVKERFLKIKQD
jgi:uncharacterized membrane protein